VGEGDAEGDTDAVGVADGAAGLGVTLAPAATGEGLGVTLAPAAMGEGLGLEPPPPPPPPPPA
jgi:hypothetical protein